MKRNDPLAVGRYRVELGDIGEALFLECSGLKNTTEVVEYWEGGENRDVHKFQGNTKFTNIVLKNGFGRFTIDLRRLRDRVVQGEQSMTFDGAIVLMDDEGNEAARWTFTDAFFARWEGPDVKGSGNTLAIHTLEIACKLWSFEIDDDRYTPPAPPTPTPPDNITALFSPMRKTIFEGEDVTFTDRSVATKAIASWEWSCPSNDGWTSEDQNPTATFDKPGRFRVTLTVTNSKGKADTTVKTVTVEPEVVKAEFEFNPDVVKDGKLDKFKYIAFKVASHELTADAKKLLDDAVQVFEDNPGLRVDLKGWASKEGDEAYNLSLSKNRARSVQNYMEHRGIGSDQIVQVDGYGETEQFGAGNAEAQLKQNRRVEWVIRPDSVTTLKIHPGDKVLFTDKSKSNTNITEWKWQCPTAEWLTPDTDQNPAATFSEPGNHPVTLQVTGKAGEVDTITHEIPVVP